jgi:hypothetical protein
MSDANAGRFPSGRLVILLLVLSAALWALLAFVTVPQLTLWTGGLPPFDVRFGYSYDEARAFLEAAGDVGRSYYLFPELTLDTIFPPLYAAAHALAFWWLTMPGRLRAGAVPVVWRCLLVALPVVELIFDGIENICIARMIESWPDLSRRLVGVSSLATQVKLVAAGLTEILLLVLAAIAVWRHFGGAARISSAPKN